MIKYGIEVEEKKEAEGSKVASEKKCPHPDEYIKTDGDVVFCSKCNQYLN